MMTVVIKQLDMNLLLCDLQGQSTASLEIAIHSRYDAMMGSLPAVQCSVI